MKLEKKLGLKLKGYEMKAKSLGEEITAAYGDIANTEIEYAVYERLGRDEQGMLVDRIGGLQEEDDVLAATQNSLQAKWTELNDAVA